MKKFIYITLAVGLGLGVLLMAYLSAQGASVIFPFQGGTGTGIVPASGSIPIGNGINTYTPATLTAGGGIQITNASGSVTISSTQTSVSSPVTVAQGGTNKTSFTAGSIVFASGTTILGENNAQFFWDNVNDALGIGTANPTAIDATSKLTISNNSGGDFNMVGSGGNFGDTILSGSEGTIAAPSTSTANDTLGQILFQGYVNSGYNPSGLISSNVISTPVSGDTKVAGALVLRSYNNSGSVQGIKITYGTTTIENVLSIAGHSGLGTVSSTNLDANGRVTATSITINGNKVVTSSVTSALRLADANGADTAFAANSCASGSYVNGISATGTVTGCTTTSTALAGYSTSTSANPTASVGTSATNGTANTFMRSDAAPSINQAATFSFSALGNTTSTANISAASMKINGDLVSTSTGASPSSTIFGAGTGLAPSGALLTVSSTIVSSTINGVISAPTTTAISYIGPISWDFQWSFAKIRCLDTGNGTTTLAIYNTTSSFSTTKNADVVASIVCGISGGSTASLTSSTLLANYGLVINVTSTTASPTDTVPFQIFGTKQ